MHASVKAVTKAANFIFNLNFFSLTLQPTVESLLLSKMRNQHELNRLLGLLLFCCFCLAL